MSEEQPYEIDIHVRSADREITRHLEVPLDHASPEDVVADITGTLDTRSGHRVRDIESANR